MRDHPVMPIASFQSAEFINLTTFTFLSIAIFSNYYQHGAGSKDFRSH